MQPGGSKPHSQRLSNNPYPEPNKKTMTKLKKKDRIRSHKSENPAVSNLIMSEWKEQEENRTNMETEWMLKNSLKSQGTIYLPKEDLQAVRKADRAT